MQYLWKIQKGDWVVHINVPYRGRCSAAQVISEYGFGIPPTLGDFGHFFEVDTNTVIEFDRNDENVLPIVSKKLKLRGRFWRIYHEEEFHASIENLKNNAVSLEGGETKEVHHLKERLKPTLKTIAEQIQQMHPDKKLEDFLAQVFEKVPGVEWVKNNGLGWGTDHGADLIVYTKQIEIAKLKIAEQRIVVQVKSYTGEIFDMNAVDQIAKAIKHYEADAGIIATTAKSTDEIEKKIEEKSAELDKPISVLAHEDLAQFVIEHSSELLFGQS